MPSPSDHYALRASLQRLDKIILATGAAESDPELKKNAILNTAGANVLDSLSPQEMERYEKLSKYAKEEFKMALELQFLRKQLGNLEEMEETNAGASKAGKIFLGSGAGRAPYSQQDISKVTVDVRKRLQKIKNATRDLQRAAQAEGKLEDYKEVLRHVETTQALYKKRFSVPVPGSGSETELGSIDGGKRGSESAPLLDKTALDLPPPASNPSEIRDSLRDDEEFQQFFAEVAQKDELIDQAVDRIYRGTARLKDQALGIKEELTRQEGLLKETEQKVDSINEKTKNLNKRLKKTIEKVDSDKFCVYIFCFVLLLGIIGGVLYVTGVIK
jgi:hypothetical protein